jgi:hypothetical protein
MRITRLDCPVKGLGGLDEMLLNPRNEKLLRDALEHNGGDAAWRARKATEGREVLQLSQLAPPGRLHVDSLDLRQHLRAVLFMRVPVPCRPGANNELPVADFAVLGLTYPREAIQQRLPGMAFVQILDPHSTWHANVSEDGQRLCLGAYLPVGIPVVELVLMAYGALSMQTVMIDEQDSALVANRDAARWWQQNVHRTPLSKTPFLAAE